MKIEKLHSIFLACNAVNTDTRTIQKNELFLALKGDNFNGNEFALRALELGAKYAVVDETEYAIDSRFLLVEDVLKSLQQLATYHRQYLNLPIIALTGSNGKTTTKELINSVLSTKFKTVATKGNLNNHIGVPLTLLSMNKQTEIGIVEMGANHQKEIEQLANIAKPNYGYITNFGKAHLEGFGGVEGIIKGKCELYDYLILNKQTIFVNGDDAIQVKKTNNTKRFIFSKDDESSDTNIKMLSCKPNVEVSYQNLKIQSNLIGEYNFTNIAAAIAIGHYFNVESSNIKNAIESYLPTNNRSQILSIGSNEIILDAYNANPTSMEAAITNISNLSTDLDKALILGDMFELGETAQTEHQAIADLTTKLNFNMVVLVGNLFWETNTNKSIYKYKSFEDFKNFFDFSLLNNCTILIKGSRGMALERIIPLLKNISEY